MQSVGPWRGYVGPLSSEAARPQGHEIVLSKSIVHNAYESRACKGMNSAKSNFPAHKAIFEMRKGHVETHTAGVIGILPEWMLDNSENTCMVD